jgi:ferric-dicitrate binding protein FerR (iron transport regulator)
MTPSEAITRAETYARLASVAADPAHRAALEQMRQLWLNLAHEGTDSGDDIGAEFERLLDMQAEFFRLPPAAGASPQ